MPSKRINSSFFLPSYHPRPSLPSLLHANPELATNLPTPKPSKGKSKGLLGFFDRSTGVRGGKVSLQRCRDESGADPHSLRTAQATSSEDGYSRAEAATAAAGKSTSSLPSSPYLSFSSFARLRAASISSTCGGFATDISLDSSCSML